MLRKTKQDKIEKQRKTFFLVGMILALGLVLAAFEYKTFDYSLSDEFTRTDLGFIDDEFVEITRHKKPEPPAQGGHDRPV